MKNIFAAAVLAAAAALAFAVPATAEIMNVSAAGPGGTVSPLEIVTVFNTNDAVIYGADYTAAAPIYLTLPSAQTTATQRFSSRDRAITFSRTTRVLFFRTFTLIWYHPRRARLSTREAHQTHSRPRPFMPAQLGWFSLVWPGFPAGLDFPMDSPLNLGSNSAWRAPPSERRPLCYTSVQRRSPSLRPGR